jgi:hypothetical protein
MNPWVTLAWLITIGSVVGFAVAVARMWFGSREAAELERGSLHQNGEVPQDLDLSFDRYQVMERLLSPRDLQFLASQTGTPAHVGNWKRESLRIFRLYLNELTSDFHALHSHARRLVAESHSESPELAAALVRQQAAFFRARLGLEARLMLFSLGVGRVDVAPLLHMVETMRLDLGRLVPEAEPAF